MVPRQLHFARPLAQRPINIAATSIVAAVDAAAAAVVDIQTLETLE